MLIAERVLKLRQGDATSEVPIRIYLPQADPERGWSCRFEIAWPDRKQEIAARGIDAVQALLNALFMIGSNLHASRYHASGDLYFETPGGGYGFPVLGVDRDLLTGADARFF